MAFMELPYTHDDKIPVMLPRQFVLDILASTSLDDKGLHGSNLAYGMSLVEIVNHANSDETSLKLLGSAFADAYEDSRHEVRKPEPMGYTSPVIPVNLPLQLVAESINSLTPAESDRLGGGMYVFGTKMIELLSAHGLANDYLPTVSRSLEEAWVLHNFGDDAIITEKVAPAPTVFIPSIREVNLVETCDIYIPSLLLVDAVSLTTSDEIERLGLNQAVTSTLVTMLSRTENALYAEVLGRSMISTHDEYIAQEADEAERNEPSWSSVTPTANNRFDRMRDAMVFDGVRYPMTQELLERAISKVDPEGKDHAHLLRCLALEVLSTLTGNSFAPVANFPLGELLIAFYSSAISKLVDIQVVTKVALK